MYLQNHKNKTTSPPLTVLLQEILCQLQDTLLWMMPFSCRSKLDQIANLLYNYELYNTIIMLLNCSLQQCLKIALGAWLHCTLKTKFKMSLFLKWRHLKWKTARCRKINDLEKCKEELQRSIMWSDCSKEGVLEKVHDPEGDMEAEQRYIYSAAGRTEEEEVDC